MRWNSIQILSSASMASDVFSQGMDLQHFYGFSIQTIWSGVPVGTLRLQISADSVNAVPAGTNPIGTNLVAQDAAASVVNWTDYTCTVSSTTAQSSSTSGSLLWNSADVGYRWVRVAYSAASGSGTLTANFIGKGF